MISIVQYEYNYETKDNNIYNTIEKKKKKKKKPEQKNLSVIFYKKKKNNKKVHKMTVRIKKHTKLIILLAVNMHIRNTSKH